MKLFTLAALTCASVLTVAAAPGSIHLVQKPTMNKTEIVFSYSGDLWRVSREGGIASRLTSGTRLRKRCRLFTRWQNPRLYGRVRWQR